MLSQISNRKGNSLEEVSLDCYISTARRAGESALASIWQPLDNALSATLESGPHRRTTFAKLKEVEVVLLQGNVLPSEVTWFMPRGGELLPSVEARGVTVTVVFRRSREEMGMLHQLRYM